MSKDSSDHVIKRFAGKGVFPYQMAFTLLIPFRNIFLSPKELISRLDLKVNSHILEVGPGPGYFSTHIAKVVTDGKLTLADIQQEMLAKAKRRIERRRLKNVEYYLCSGYNFNLQDESFDIIFLVTVIGEIEEKKLYIREFNRLLRKDGILSISELKGDPDKISSAELKQMIIPAGFTFDRMFGNEDNYTINFRKL